MAFTFVKAKGGKVGNSLVEDDFLDMALEIIEKARAKNVRLIIPTDAIVADTFSNDANKQEVDITKVPDGWMGLDVGQNTVKECDEVIKNSKIILWNGPMGVFEFSNFEKGTKAVAYSIVEATKNGAFTLIGGGDSVAAINKFDLASEVSYVSTGGGAMLEYLEGKVLPGITAILN
jgi:phosphoglycerate kinase